MSRAKVNKNICCHCKLGPPLVELAMDRGQSRGICKGCRNLQQQHKRIKTHAFKDFYSQTHNLQAANYKVLAALKTGTYCLTYRATEKQAGYITLTEGAYYVSLFGENLLFRVDLFGMTTYLSNLNVVIGSDRMRLESIRGTRIDLDKVGVGMPLLNIQDRLVMYDVKMREYAVNKVKEEIAEAKLEREALLKKTAQESKKKEQT